MTEKKFRKFASNLDGGKFRELAEAAVDFDCKNLDGTKINGTARDNLIEVMSLDYQTGSNFTKNKYFTVGCVSGVMAVISFLFIKKVLNQKRRSPNKGSFFLRESYNLYYGEKNVKPMTN